MKITFLCKSVLVTILTLMATEVLLMAQPPKTLQPSKIPYLIRERIETVSRSLAATGGARLSEQTVAAISDEFLKVDRDGRLLLELHAAGLVGEKEEAQVKSMGAVITFSTARMSLPRGIPWPRGLGVIQAWVPHNRVEQAAKLSWVVAITAAEQGHTDVGSVTSQGVQLHNADDADMAGIDGSGLQIGVISDGVSNLASAVASGDLPSSVNVISVGSGDEGTAMLEIIHDMAPGAQLLFHGNGSGVAGHVVALNALVAGGADVIAEDIAFDTEPAFQQGMAVKVAQDIAGSGVSIHSSAGNLAERHAARVRANGTGQGPDGSAGPFTGCMSDPLNVVDIDSGSGNAFDVAIPASGQITITLQWSEPRAIFPTAGAGGFTDLDLYLTDSTGVNCLARSLSTQGGGAGDTLEQISYFNATASILNAKIVVNLRGGSGAVAAPLLDLRWRGANAVDPADRAGSLNPDSNYTADATSSAAANAASSTDPMVAPLESYSAAGPVHLESTTICSGGTYPCAGGVAGTTPFNGGGPHWTAADAVNVSGAGTFPTTFFGTSAAAPHAAACDALVRQTLQQEGTIPTVGLVNDRLRGTATPRGGASDWGAGILNCHATVRMLILLDRTGSMTELRANGHSRCRDALDLAKQDVTSFFMTHPAGSGGAVAVWTFAGSAPSQLTSFVDQAQALAALNTLTPEGCSDITPLADAICAASDALSTALPGSGMNQRILAISSDGGENNSVGPCSGPSSSGGPPYDPGSWQQKVSAAVVGQGVTLTRFWGGVRAPAIDPETGRAVGLGVSDASFFQQLAADTNGSFFQVFDNGPLPNPLFGNGGSMTEIPTLNDWGLAVMIMILGGSGLILVLRRRKTA